MTGISSAWVARIRKGENVQTDFFRGKL